MLLEGGMITKGVILQEGEIILGGIILGGIEDSRGG